jgi:hypothetical protein
MTYRASSDLVRLTIIVLVVCRVTVTVHSHDVREYGAWSVVLVRVEEETKTLEFVRVAKDIAWLASLLGEPHGKAISIQIALAANLELEFDLLA